MGNFLTKAKLYSQDYIPKSFISLREGYSFSLFLNDLFAGITVGIIALPLAMAFAIGSGVPPERGLFTAIIAGFLISLLGGSRVQIGGPTGAFVVIVYGIVQKYGYDGLAVATLIGGVLIILMGLFRCGVLLRFIPYPVTTGFTTGIAVTIFSAQIKDFFGLQIGSVPAEFMDKWFAYAAHMHTCSFCALFLAIGTLALIFTLRHFYPRFPGTILAVILATLVTYFFGLPIETIETKFGGIPNMLPEPSLPYITWERIQEVFPAAITIALLGGIESLLSAMVADGMTGYRHRSNCELVAQGIANIGSVLFGGIPATGAIARTTANIKMGAKTPVAGMTHAVTLLLLMLFLSPLAAKVPLAGLSAVLIFVAWNMSEIPHFIEILRSEFTDSIVLVLTFLLTVLIDLTVAVQVGVILSAILFLKKMSDSTTVEACKILLSEEEKQAPELYDGDILFREDVPHDVTVFEMKGPFFFGVSDLLNETIRRLPEKPRVFILRMRQVPMIDTTGLQALKNFTLKCKEQNILFLISGAQPKVLSLFKTAKLDELIGKSHLFPHIDAALNFARQDKSQEALPLRTNPRLLT
jgi:sulfate permease, SulP family